MRLRRPRTEDRSFLLELLRGLPEFSEAEVACAMELLDESTNDPEGSGYWGMVAALEGGADGLPGEDDRPIGYAIYGPTPMTEGAFDLYWIASRTDLRGKGIGRALLAEVEADVRAHGGFVVRIETSAKDAYGATRKFYEATHYHPAGHIRDFYRRGDDLVILSKDLEAVPALDSRTPRVEGDAQRRPLRQ